MKKTAIFVLFLTLSMLSMASLPALGAPPTAETFTLGVVEVGTVPPKRWITDDILHERGGIGNSYLYGAPWGPGNGLSSLNVEINVASFTGHGIAHVEDAYATGTVKGIANINIIGPGSYTYEGPTFTFTLPGKTGTVTHGQTFDGILVTANVVWHGEGGLEGLQIRGTSTGVNIRSGPLAGLRLRSVTTTCWFAP